MRVKNISYTLVRPFVSKAAKDHVSLKDSKDTFWYGVEESDELIGIAGLLKVKNGYRIKGVYIKPSLRGQGIGSTLTEFLINQCDSKFAMIEAFAYNPSFYEKRGFKRYGQLPNGAVKLRKLP